MLNNKEFNQAEKLSECLDHLNGGRQFIAQDEEIQELVEMANFVKQSCRQEVIPQLLIGELVDKLASELQARKQHKGYTHWLYGGLVGTVAAVLIAAFVQFLVPPAVDHHIAQQFYNNGETQKNVAIADQTSVPILSQATSPMIEQQVQSGSSAEAPAPQLVVKKANDNLSKVIAEIIPVAELPAIEQKSNQVAILRQGMPQDMTRTKSVLMAKMDISPVSEDVKTQLDRRVAIMVLPYQTTQSITVDNTSGVIRQVYNQGTNDEIIITQRLHDESRVRTRDSVKQGPVLAVAESSAIQTINKDVIMNSLTVKVDKYLIRIAGNKTNKELQKIAESLIMKDIEQ